MQRSDILLFLEYFQEIVDVYIANCLSNLGDGHISGGEKLFSLSYTEQKQIFLKGDAHDFLKSYGEGMTAYIVGVSNLLECQLPVEMIIDVSLGIQDGSSHVAVAAHWE